VIRHVTLSRYLLVFALVSAGCGMHRGKTATLLGPSSNLAKASGFAATLESTDERLTAALAQLSRMPTSEAHRQVAVEYRRLGVLDHAQEHFTAALKLDPKDVKSRDGLARIWRDWGFPNMALPEARRAVADAPRSAAAANTLGTVFQALGMFDDAKRWYWRAVQSVLRGDHDAAAVCHYDLRTRRRRSTRFGNCEQQHGAGACCVGRSRRRQKLVQTRDEYGNGRL